jgi:DtxR family transcriptional regulator, Mn-dependent transcriptional regulator
MVDPLTALLVFVALVSLVAALSWPRRGVAARVLRLMERTEHVRLEDALEHIHQCEYQHQPCTVASIAGAVEVSRSRAVRLIARLQASGMLRTDGAELLLTDLGRSEARRVVRSHRIWERYLADRTGLDPSEWHDEAERREHTLGRDRVEELAASMGHPVYDPHGDPIPTADGELPHLRGRTVDKLAPGQWATVVHLEDEPRDVFEQLVALGLAPGTPLRMLHTGPDALRVELEGRPLDLEPVVAANITVVPRTEPVHLAWTDTLADLAPGETGTVVAIAPQCHGVQRRRLLDLGLVPGTPVAAELTGAIAGPVAYRIRGALIALRPQQAQLVRLESRARHAKVS